MARARSQVSINGRLFELDGNNDGPIDLGAIKKPDGFLHAAVAHVKEVYIKPFPESHFSMMALGPRDASSGSGS